MKSKKKGKENKNPKDEKKKELPKDQKEEKIVTEGANALDLETLAGTAVPTGELGYPSDIANAVLFLASEESRYMTGTEVVVDAGLCA
mgnify:CR=1 FL=1